MSTKSDPVIATKDLDRNFGDVVAVQGLTLQVYPGEVFGFPGQNKGE